MKKILNWVLAAILICGASVFTACSSNDDNAATPDLNLSEKIIGKWILAETNGKPTPTNHKYGIAEKLETAEHLTDKMLDGAMAQYRPITVRITHSEQSGVTALDFMVEQMTATPLSDSQRSALSALCQQVVEEPTKRGFRVKLIL